MYILQLTQTPVQVDLPDGRRLLIPKLTIDEIMQWGNEVMEERAARVTQDMNELQMREYFTFYPAMPPDLREMRGLIRTPQGIERVMKFVLPKANVFKITDKGDTGAKIADLTEAEINQIISASGTGRLAVTAWDVSDLDESAGYKKIPEKKEDGKDPLSNSGKQGSKTSVMTGQKTSQSGTLSIPEKTQGNVL